ncbi:MAG: ABC transporter substrate-binding protein [Chitinivibrionales bacterium]|nr:ABC transporter substrate-binding protein [Chitinivibrionales bacterium]
MRGSKGSCMKTFYRLLLLALINTGLMVLHSGCSPQEETGTRHAFVSILPHRSIAQRVAGDRFAIHVLVGPGQSPHSYTPTPGQIVKLSESRLFFRAGVEFEEGILPKINKTMPDLTVVDLRKDIPLREMECDHGRHHHDHDEHGHNDSEVHHHNGGTDPHIWLSPVLMKTQAATIKDVFVEADPEGKGVYETNLKALHADLDSLNSFLHETLDPISGTELFVFHPSFGYFADEYGFHQQAIEIAGKEPSAKTLAHLIDQAREHQPKVIFVQPQFSQKSARAIAEQVECAVVPINPLPEDYLKEMREMGEKINAALE